MAHIDTDIITEMIQATIYSMKATENFQRNKCTTSVQEKSTKAPSRGNIIGHSANATIHAYICGPLKTPTFGGNEYFVMMTSSHER